MVSKPVNVLSSVIIRHGIMSGFLVTAKEHGIATKRWARREGKIMTWMMNRRAEMDSIY